MEFDFGFIFFFIDVGYWEGFVICLKVDLEKIL